MINKKSKIFLAGHKGMVGSAILRALKKKNYINIICKEKKTLDLLNQSKVNNFFKNNNIDTVIIAAAKVGGILHNSLFPYEFLYENLMIQSNIINAAYNNNIRKIFFLGSSCIYPKDIKQPIKEEMLLSSYLEKTNESYALAKIAGIKLCNSLNEKYNWDCRALMPTNLFGPNDNFDLKTSHVLPALIRKVYEAKKYSKNKVIIWGTGQVKREFLHVDDLADYFLKIASIGKKRFKSISNKNCFINVGHGSDIKIIDLAKTICKILDYNGKLVFDKSKPNGVKRKLLDITKLERLGIRKEINLEKRIKETINWYITNEKKFA